MSDSNGILDKYARNGDGKADRDQEENEITEDLGSFGFLRGTRERACSLELRKKTGSILAIGYSWIEKFEFDPSDGITLHALGQTIHIKGRNLNSELRPQINVFTALCRHRVPWLQEVDQAADIGSDDNAAVVEQIEFE